MLTEYILFLPGLVTTYECTQVILKHSIIYFSCENISKTHFKKYFGHSYDDVSMCCILTQNRVEGEIYISTGNEIDTNELKLYGLATKTSFKTDLLCAE